MVAALVIAWVLWNAFSIGVEHERSFRYVAMSVVDLVRPIVASPRFGIECTLNKLFRLLRHVMPRVVVAFARTFQSDVGNG